MSVNQQIFIHELICFYMQIVCPLLLYSLLQSCEDSTLLPLLHKITKQNWLLINALRSTDSWPEDWCFTSCSISNLVYVGMLTTLEIIQKTFVRLIMRMPFISQSTSVCYPFLSISCFLFFSSFLFFPPHFSRHAPCRETINPYYVNTGHVMAPATSANDSEQQSMSSDADTISLTDSSVYVFWLHPNISHTVVPDKKCYAGYNF